MVVYTLNFEYDKLKPGYILGKLIKADFPYYHFTNATITTDLPETSFTPPIKK